jgi:hypothetical protein
MVFFEIRFLPYHSYLTTWLQRIAIFCDLFVVWKLWLAIVRTNQSTYTGVGLLRRVAVWPVLLISRPACPSR